MSGIDLNSIIKSEKYLGYPMYLKTIAQYYVTISDEKNLEKIIQKIESTNSVWRDRDHDFINPLYNAEFAMLYLRIYDVTKKKKYLTYAESAIKKGSDFRHGEVIKIKGKERTYEIYNVNIAYFVAIARLCSRIRACSEDTISWGSKEYKFAKNGYENNGAWRYKSFSDTRWRRYLKAIYFIDMHDIFYEIVNINLLLENLSAIKIVYPDVYQDVIKTINNGVKYIEKNIQNKKIKYNEKLDPCVECYSDIALMYHRLKLINNSESVIQKKYDWIKLILEVQSADTGDYIISSDRKINEEIWYKDNIIENLSLIGADSCVF